MLQIPRDLGPEGSEVAVLSLLAVDSEGRKLIRAGSLLTYPNVAQGFSWKEWRERQPSTRGPRIPRNEPDLGASFEEEPFAGVHIYRSVLDAGEWLKTVNDLEARKLKSQGETYWLEAPDWSACRLFCQFGESDSHHVLWEAQRPIRGVTTTTSGPEMPHVEGLWLKGSSAFKPFGQRSREELIAGETFANWPIHLLGIWWPGTDDTDAPHSFVVGEAQDNAWIADVVPEHDLGLLKIAIAWESSKTDPFSCSLLVESELDGAALLVRNWRISDLPGEGAVKEDGSEARDLSWNERTLDVLVPRGPRGTCWALPFLVQMVN